MVLVLSIEFIALFLLMLVTAVFFGPWFALHRSLHVFNASEFIHIVKTMAANLAIPMRIIMPCCIFFLCLSTWLYPDHQSLEFYMKLIACGLTITSLLITLMVELPIVTQVQQWNPANMPANWEALRDRWVRFHVLRTFASLASFACFTYATLFLY
jgi:uncharacterized membrane protein